MNECRGKCSSGGRKREGKRGERDKEGLVYATPCNARREGMVVNDMFKKRQATKPVDQRCEGEPR